MHFRKWLSLSLLSWLLISCGKDLPEFQNIDMAQWREDKNGCLGNRVRTIDALRSQKDKLKALSEMEIVKLLGRPDRNELYKRNQKFYYYFLEPGIDCGVDNSNPAKLSLRFNAMGLAKEVTVE